jgi:hypothetical protein
MAEAVVPGGPMSTEAMLALPLVEFAGSPVAGLDVVDLLNTCK